MNKCRKRIALAFFSFCFLLVACLFVPEKKRCSWEEKGGVEVEKKEFFAVWMVLFLLQKDGIRSRKENKVRSK